MTETARTSSSRCNGSSPGCDRIIAGCEWSVGTEYARSVTLPTRRRCSHRPAGIWSRTRSPGSSGTSPRSASQCGAGNRQPTRAGCAPARNRQNPPGRCSPRPIGANSDPPGTPSSGPAAAMTSIPSRMAIMCAAAGRSLVAQAPSQATNRIAVNPRGRPLARTSASSSTIAGWSLTVCELMTTAHSVEPCGETTSAGARAGLVARGRPRPRRARRPSCRANVSASSS